MGWGAVAQIGGSLLSSWLGSKGSSDAASSQKDAANYATDIGNQQYQQTRRDNMPALGARNDALTQLEYELGIGGGKGSGKYGALGGPISTGDVTTDPGYQFGLRQGQASISGAANAHGMRDSGAALAAAARYGTDYATTKYDDAFNRQVTNRGQQMNPLLSLAGAGQVGANQIGQAGQNYANQAGQNAMYAGEAGANNSLAQASIWGNTGNQLAGWYANSQRPSGANPGNSYWSNGNQYANWDLSGTNRGSGD